VSPSRWLRRANVYLISGDCNDCGQCCGCETAPNRTSPFDPLWPESVRNWEIDFLANTHKIFRIIGHPALAGTIYGRVRIGNVFYYWRWLPREGLVANLPPYADETTWAPQCPLLKAESQGTYPCGVKGETLQIPGGGTMPGDELRQSLSCRELGMPPTMRDEEWEQWHSDHPACSYVATPV
jgi:Fe-S-cluster containining protein